MCIRDSQRSAGLSMSRNHQWPVCGATGVKRSFQPISSGVRFPFTLLHERQHATRLVHEFWPPRLRGSTWSTVFAPSPQYAHRFLSRRSTPLRESAVVRPRGGCTYRLSRITEGWSMDTCALRMSMSSLASTVALPAKTRTIARLKAVSYTHLTLPTILRV